MKITVTQKYKKLLVSFKSGNVVDNYAIDKADEFLAAIDKFIKRRKMHIKVLKKTDLKFVNTGILTERVIRSIMLGLRFPYKLAQN